MDTPIEKLQTAIRDLESELRGVSEIDTESRKMLETAIQEIQSIILAKGPTELAASHKAATSPKPSSTISSRLLDSIDEFESTHPRMTMLVSTITDLLAQMGI